MRGSLRRVMINITSTSLFFSSLSYFMNFSNDWLNARTKYGAEVTSKFEYSFSANLVKFNVDDIGEMVKPFSELEIFGNHSVE